MCVDCGCGEAREARLTLLTGPNPGQLAPDPGGAPHSHRSAHPHPHSGPDRPASHTVSIERAVLAKNDRFAEQNRLRFRATVVRAVNLMSSPGSGKTSLLERTIRELSGTTPISVIEGDQETQLDAERIRATGCPVVQINTGAGCHLDAEMLGRGVVALDPFRGSLLFVENVGNLVCPALFDLGESSRVVVISVTEGDDKPLKYPHMFATADLIVVNKTDLLPYVDFDVQACADRARSLNPAVTVITASAKTGEGLEDWYAWLAR